MKQVSKIIYINQEVAIGDVIDFKGLKVRLTQEIINNNPKLFEVIDLKKVGLDYYEKLLSCFKTPLYVELKELEPKLYYTKVLQLISKNLDDSIGTVKWFFYKDRVSGEIGIHSIYSKYIHANEVCFSSPEVAEKALKIIGNNIKYLFK